MILLNSIYGVACNSCGKGCPMFKGPTVFFSEVQEALNNAVRQNWKVVNPNLALCPECAAKEEAVQQAMQNIEQPEGENDGTGKD